MSGVNIREQTANYVVNYNSSGAQYYAINAKLGTLEFHNATLATVLQSCIDALVSGGCIVLKDAALPAGLTYGSSILIVVYNAGEVTYYRNGAEIFDAADLDDAVDKKHSQNTDVALNVSVRDVANGYPTLDSSGRLKLAQIYPNVPGLDSSGKLVLSQIGAKCSDLATLWDKTTKIAIGDTSIDKDDLTTLLTVDPSTFLIQAVKVTDLATIWDKSTKIAFGDTSIVAHDLGLGNVDSPSFVALTLTQAIGTAPLTVTSTTEVTNLNAQLWHGAAFGDYLDQAVKTTSTPTFAAITSLIATGVNLSITNTNAAQAAGIQFKNDLIGETHVQQYQLAAIGSGVVGRANTFELYDLTRGGIALSIDTLGNGWFAGYVNPNFTAANFTTNTTTGVGIRFLDSNVYGMGIDVNGGVQVKSYYGSFKIYKDQGAGLTELFSFGTTGQLQLPIQGENGGLLIGGDTSLYRIGANYLFTPNNFIVGLDYNVMVEYGAAKIDFGDRSGAWDVNLYRAGANILKTDDNFVVALDFLGLQKIVLMTSTGAIGGTALEYLSREASGTISVSTRNADGSAAVERIRVGGNAAQGAAGIISYELFDISINGAPLLRLTATGDYAQIWDLMDNYSGTDKLFCIYDRTNTKLAMSIAPDTLAINLYGSLTLQGGNDLVLATTTGTKIGTAANQLLGFYGVTPVDQPATVTDPSGGGVQDAEARTAIGALIDRLQELGLIA